MRAAGRGRTRARAGGERSQAGRLRRALGRARRGHRALSRAWGAVRHLNAVMDTPGLRAAYTENLPRITEFHTRMGATSALYAKYKAILRRPAAPPERRGAGAEPRGARLRALRRAELQGRGQRPASRRSRSARPSCRAASPNTCSTPPTASHYASRSSTACRPTWSRPPAPPRRRAWKAASSRCIFQLFPGDAVRAQPRPAREALRPT